MPSKRRLVRWGLLLLMALLLLGAVAYAWQAFHVSEWQRLDVSRLTDLAQTGAIYDRNNDYVTTLVGR